ncbi:hypothetical protein QVD99_005725 [Batrachochytrium dendrobatidis]|nr:hypothetical protein QVD99_005725 [Batrachochytrium dendrobatidis]
MTSLVQHHTAIRIHNSDINNMMTLPVRLNGLQLPLHPRQLLAILYVLVSLSVFLTLHMSVIASMTIRTTLYVWSVSCAVLLSVLSMALMWSDPVDRSLYTESYHHNVVLTETPSSESKIQTPAVPQHGNRVQRYYRLGLDYKPDPFQSAKPTNDMPTHDPSLQFCTVCACNVRLDSLHCRYCNKCVRRIDHHCFYVNNCIGYYNYRLYIQTMLAAFTHSLTMTIVAVYVLIVCSINGSNTNNSGFGLAFGTIQWITGVDAVFSLIVTVYLAYLISLHMYLYIHGLTTLEYSHGQKTAVQSARSSTSKNSQTNGLCCQSKTNFSWKVYPTVESNDNVLPK